MRLQIPSLGCLALTDQQNESALREPINLSLFPVEDPAVNMSVRTNIAPWLKKAHASSVNRVYVSRPCGTFLDCEIPPGRWLLVPSTFNPTEVGYHLTVYSSKPVSMRKVTS